MCQYVILLWYYVCDTLLLYEPLHSTLEDIPMCLHMVPYATMWYHSVPCIWAWYPLLPYAYVTPVYHFSVLGTLSYHLLWYPIESFVMYLW